MIPPGDAGELRRIARRLSDEGHDVTVIDTDAALIRRVTDKLDVGGVVGHASHPDVQERAGAVDADMIFAVTHLDEVNMIACQIAHTEFNVPQKIARVRAKGYLETRWSDLFRRDHMPIDVVISPETEVAKVAISRLRKPAAFDLSNYLDGAVHIAAINLDGDCAVINTPLRQLTGQAEFNQVHFDAVFVPDAQVLGEPGQTLLGLEGAAERRARADDGRGRGHPRATLADGQQRRADRLRDHPGRHRDDAG